MPDKLHLIYKKCGQTPLDCINELKIKHPELKNTPCTYAGRLDPLASGLLVILTADECLKKDEYLSLDKEYEVEVLFGFATDTYDVMGKITHKASAEEVFERSSDLLAGDSDGRGQTISNTSSASAMIKNIIPQFTGKITQAYPAYSSRTVEGKPLYQWAREGKIGEITIPSHEVYVENIEVLDTYLIEARYLESKIKEMISNVSGDFRQKEIVDLWEKELENKKDLNFQVVKLRINCGSGVYVRSIANDMGVALGVPALALSIVRTKIGEYSVASIDK
jgi:tRNA pseudouridine55 synthase